MKIQDFFKKNMAGAVIGGLYFLFAYYVMDAKKSVTGDLLGLGTWVGQAAFFVDLIVAVLVGAVLQQFIGKK